MLALAATAAAAPRTVEKRRPGSVPGDVVPGELLVQFRRGVTRAEGGRAVAAAAGRIVDRIPAARVAVVKLPPGLPAAAALARFRADRRVAIAEPNYVLRTRAVPPNDDLYSGQWALENISQAHLLADDPSMPKDDTAVGTTDADVDAETAWAVTQGNSNTVIAIVDDGVDTAHPDLAANIWSNTGEVVNNVDDDGNGYKDDVNGWDFVGDDKNPRPPASSDDEHGTFVAGTAAAATNNSEGIAGMCPQCRIMPLRVHTLSQWIEALHYARRNGADIVNMSLGGYRYSQLERNAIAAAQNTYLLVVAADNFSLDNDMALGLDVEGGAAPDVFTPAYPGVYTLPNILHVAATNHKDEYAYDTYCRVFRSKPKSVCAFTNWGFESVDVAAPGVDMYGPIPGTGYDVWNGTSFSAPLTAGIAALVKSAHPTYTPAQVRNVVMNSVDKPPLLGTMYASSGLFRSAAGKFVRTNGRVNAAAALDPTTSTANAFPTTDGNVNGARGMSTPRVSGGVRWPDDINDVWRKKLTRGATYRVILDGKNGQDFDLWVWKPGTKEIWQDFGGCAGCKLIDARLTTTFGNVESLRFTARSTAVHYFQVQAWVRQTGGYLLKIRRL